jgi:hypothetical protein
MGEGGIMNKIKIAIRLKLAQRIFNGWIKSPLRRQLGFTNKRTWDDLSGDNQANLLFMADWHLKELKRLKK